MSGIKIILGETRNHTLHKLKFILLKKHDTFTEEGRIVERERRIALTACLAMINRVLAIIIPLLTVRITLSYLGNEIYGLWSTVTSFFALFVFADLGLGSGLQTELSRCTGSEEKEKEKKIVSSTYAVLFMVSACLLVMFAFIYPFINWAGLINAKSEQAISMSGGVIAGVFIAKILNVTLSLIERIENAYQEGYKYYLWACCGNILSLISVILISNMQLGKMTMIWVSSMMVVFVAVLNTIVYFGFQHKGMTPKFKFIDLKIAKEILKVGMLFFVLSIMTSVSLSFDNFIVAKVTSLSDVTPYTITYKIAHIIAVVGTMLSRPLWSAYGEAIVRKEIGWIERSTKRMAKLSMILAMLGSIVIIILIKPAMKMLTDGAVVADYSLLVAMCITQIFTAYSSVYFMVLNSNKVIKFQIVVYLIYATISLPLKYFLGKQMGISAVAWVGTITYIIIVTIPTIMRGKKEIRTLMHLYNSES